MIRRARQSPVVSGCQIAAGIAAALDDAAAIPRAGEAAPGQRHVFTRRRWRFTCACGKRARADIHQPPPRGAGG